MMEPRTLEALKGSIEKWRKIVEEGGEEKGYDNCPLCHLFNDGEGCHGCPVVEATGAHFCENSPFIDWERQRRESKSRFADTDEKMIAARAELDFLRSLLPKEEASK